MAIDEESRTLLGNDSDSLKGLEPRAYGATASGSASGTVTPNIQEQNKLSTSQLICVLGALWSSVFLGALDSTIVATLLTSIGSHFNRAHQASYLGSAYLLSVCCFTSLYGRLSDIIGRKGAMMLAQTLFTVGTLLCGLAPTMNTLIAARAIAGMGGGGVMTVSSITVTDLIPLKQRGLYQGLANILFGLGFGLGGPLGGYINDNFGWRWAFILQVPLLVVAIVLVAIFVDIKLPNQNQTTQEKLQRIDYRGSITLASTVGSLLLAVTLRASEEVPWSDPRVWGLLLISGIMLVAFIHVEGWVAKEPIMPLRLLKQRTPRFVALSNFAVALTSFSTLYNVPIYFTAVRLYSAERTGLRLLPNAFALAAGSVVAGLYMRKTGKFYKFTLLSGFLGVVSSVLLASWNENTHPLHLWLDITASGFGMSSLITTTLIALIAAVGREDVAVATGISYLFRTTGQVIGVALSGALLQSLLLKALRERITGPGADELIRAIRHSTTIIPSLDPPIRRAAVDSYAHALKIVFWWQAAVAVITLLLVIPIEENPLPGSHEEQEALEEARRQRLAANGDE